MHGCMQNTHFQVIVLRLPCCWCPTCQMKMIMATYSSHVQQAHNQHAHNETDSTMMCVPIPDFYGPDTVVSEACWKNAACAFQVPLFASLSPSQKSQLCTALRPLHVKAGTAVVRAGDAGNTFYVVEAGACTVHSSQGQVGQPCLSCVPPLPSDQLSTNACL